MKRKIIGTIILITVLVLGFGVGIKYSDQKNNAKLNAAFSAGIKVTGDIKSGKAEDVYGKALADFTDDTTLAAFQEQTKPLVNDSYKARTGILYTDNSGGYIFVQEFENDKGEFVGQLTVSLLTTDDGKFVVANIVT